MKVGDWVYLRDGAGMPKTWADYVSRGKPLLRVLEPLTDFAHVGIDNYQVHYPKEFIGHSKQATLQLIKKHLR
jgi:hypothetical protein